MSNFETRQFGILEFFFNEHFVENIIAIDAELLSKRLETSLIKIKGNFSLIIDY